MVFAVGAEHEPHWRNLPARQRVRLPQPDQPAEALRHTLRHTWEVSR